VGSITRTGASVGAKVASMTGIDSDTTTVGEIVVAIDVGRFVSPVPVGASVFKVGTGVGALVVGIEVGYSVENVGKGVGDGVGSCEPSHFLNPRHTPKK